jgi:hypothetical protein
VKGETASEGLEPPDGRPLLRLAKTLESGGGSPGSAHERLGGRAAVGQRANGIGQSGGGRLQLRHMLVDGRLGGGPGLSSVPTGQMNAGLGDGPTQIVCVGFQFRQPDARPQALCHQV